MDGVFKFWDIGQAENWLMEEVIPTLHMIMN